jgi:hypothetical protein
MVCSCVSTLHFYRHSAKESIDIFDFFQFSSIINRQETNTMQPFSNPADACNFIEAGNAYVTLVSKKTSARFTYRVRRPDPLSTIHFISVLTSPEIYQYLGVLDRGVYRQTAKSKIDPNAPSAQAWLWAWTNLRRNVLPEQLEVWHEGRCGRCGRQLTVPSSIAKGLGPTCETLY